MAVKGSGKHKITISVGAETVRKARILAARRATSISRLLAEQIENLVAFEEVLERSEREVLALLESARRAD